MKKVPGLVFGVLLFAVPKAGANITVSFIHRSLAAGGATDKR